MRGVGRSGVDEEGGEEGVKTGEEERQVGEPRVVDLYWWVRQACCWLKSEVWGTRREGVGRRKSSPDKDRLGHKLGILKAQDKLREEGNLARLRFEGRMVGVFGWMRGLPDCSLC